MAILPLVALAAPDPDDNPPGTEPAKSNPAVASEPSRQLAHVEPPKTPPAAPTTDVDKAPRKELTDKQLAFVNAYTGPARYNGQQAAILAHGSTTDPEYAGQLAFSYLSNEAVRATIRERANAHAIPPEAITHSLTDMATFDPSQFGDSLYTHDATTCRRVVNWEAVKAAGIGPFIREIACSGKQAHETIRWYSRMEAFTILARIHGLTRDRLDIGIVDVRKATDEELARLADS